MAQVENQTTNEFKMHDLSDRSRVFLTNVVGFVECKRAVDKTALEVLPHKWMELHPSFEHKSKMIQKNAHGEKVTNCEELYEVARRAKPIFDGIMQQIVLASDLNPDEEVKVNDEPLMLDHEHSFHVLSLAPLKGAKRCKEKAENEYNKNYSLLMDVVRCSIVVFTEEQMENVAQALSGDKKHDGYEILRLKNRFRVPLFNGYRDALYSILVDCGDGIYHVCEVQLHLAAVVAHKEKSHLYYEYFRAYFSGSGAVEQRMTILNQMGGFGQDVDRGLASVLAGTELDQLAFLGDLVGPKMMGDVTLTTLVRKRIFELDPSLNSKIRYAEALKSQGKFDEAETLFREALEERKRELGENSNLTLVSLTSIGSVLKAKGKLAESEIVMRDVLDRRRELLGPNHLDTLTSLVNLGMVLQALDRCDEAVILLRDAMVGYRRKLGNLHVSTIVAINNLAYALQTQRKYEDAEELYREGLSGYRQLLGNDHVSTLSAISNLGLVLKLSGQLEESEILYRESLSGRMEQLGPNHPHTLSSCNNLAGLLQEQEKYEEAELLYRDTLQRRRDHLGSDHVDTLRSAHLLGSLLLLEGKKHEASTLLQEVVVGRKKHLGDAHADTVASISKLAQCTAK